MQTEVSKPDDVATVPTEAERPAPVEDAARLADLTLAEFVRHLARYGGTIWEEEGLVLFAGPHAHPNPYRNGAIRLEARLPAAEVLRRADEFFAARASGYALWVREHADSDLDALARPRMVRDLERLPELLLESLPSDIGAPEGVELRRAVDAQTRLDYLRIVADGWGFGSMPLELAAKVFFDPASVAAPNVVAFVAYYEGYPLSGAMSLVSHGVALGCQAATIRRARAGQPLPPVTTGRRGLAESCLYSALQVSFRELGARRSLCQTSSAGEPVWRNFGYQPLTGYGRYLILPPSRS